MISLIKNELTKIFHKKTIYIVLIIAIVFIIVNAILTNVLKNNTYYNNDDIAFYEEQLKLLDKNDPYYKEMYISFKSQLELAKLTNKYERDSWQMYVISSKGSEIIEQMVSNEGTQQYNDMKKQYDKFVEKLNTNDKITKAYISNNFKDQDIINKLKEKKLKVEQ